MDGVAAYGQYSIADLWQPDFGRNADDGLSFNRDLGAGALVAWQGHGFFVFGGLGLDVRGAMQGIFGGSIGHGLGSMAAVFVVARGLAALALVLGASFALGFRALGLVHSGAGRLGRLSDLFATASKLRK